MAVIMTTSLGDVVIDLHSELCPLAAKNFLKLCKLKYYNNCLFHDVAKDFIAQTGDPTGNGSGGDSVYKYLYGDQARFFNDEFHPKLTHAKIGTVAMASGGENLNASQFYITLRDGLDYLDGKHTVFGEVAEGLETLARINEAFVDEKGRPFKNIRIKHVDILDDPFEDPPQLLELIPDKSPELKPPAEGEEVRLEDDWVPLDEQMDPEELDKSLRKKEALSRAVVLEMIGDLPEAEVAPPENVLFICKLNPVTEEGDLETIFSRFGKIVAADIIRDYKSGDSLCYGFIEFDNKESCEAAYFKMDNVLIDDRRIHVDFSQSVARLWTRFRKFGSKDVDQGEGRAPVKGKGGGCFNCGEYGHLKKDCPNSKNCSSEKDAAHAEKPKYVLKDPTGQRGQSRSRYEMVFEDDVEALHSGILKDSSKSRSRHATTSMPSQRRSEDYDDARRARSRFAANDYATSRKSQARSLRHRNREGSTGSDDSRKLGTHLSSRGSGFDRNDQRSIIDQNTKANLLDEGAAEPSFSSRDRTIIDRDHRTSDERLRERRRGRQDSDIMAEKRARSPMSSVGKQDSGRARARKSDYHGEHYTGEKNGFQYVESGRGDFIRNNQHRDRATRERSELLSDDERQKRNYDEREDTSQMSDHYRARRKERHDLGDEEQFEKRDRADRSQRSRRYEQNDRHLNFEHRSGSRLSPSSRGQDGRRSHHSGRDDHHRAALADGRPDSNEDIKIRRRSPSPARERHIDRRDRSEKHDRHTDRYARDG